MLHPTSYRSGSKSRRQRSRRSTVAPVLQCLEERRLLSVASADVFRAQLSNATDFAAPTTAAYVNLKYANVDANSTGLVVQSDGSLLVAQSGLYTIAGDFDFIAFPGSNYVPTQILVNGAVVDLSLATSISGQWNMAHFGLTRQFQVGEIVQIQTRPDLILAMDNGPWSNLDVVRHNMVGQSPTANTFRAQLSNASEFAALSTPAFENLKYANIEHNSTGLVVQSDGSLLVTQAGLYTIAGDYVFVASGFSYVTTQVLVNGAVADLSLANTTNGQWNTAHFGLTRQFQAGESIQIQTRPDFISALADGLWSNLDVVRHNTVGQSPSANAFRAQLSNATDFAAPTTAAFVNLKYANVDANSTGLVVQTDGSILVAQAGLYTIAGDFDFVAAPGSNFVPTQILVNGALVDLSLATSIGGQWNMAHFGLTRQFQAGEIVQIQTRPDLILAMDNGLWSNLDVVRYNVIVVNEAPVARDDAYTTSEDTTLTVVSPGVLSNDTDADGGSLITTLVSGPAHGTVSLNSNGSFTYTPATNYNGPDSFTYKTNDGSLDSGNATVSITVTAVNDAPVLSNVPPAVTINEAEPYSFTSTAADIDSPTLTFTLVGGPLNASIGAASGVFAWTPTEAQGAGTYSFKVRVSDGTATADADITITVNEVNVAPVVSGVPTEMTVPEMQAVNFTATATDDDAPVQSLVFSLLGAPSGASIGGSSGVFTWVPGEDQGPGTYTFTVRVSDGVIQTDRPITLHVTEVNQAPVLVIIGDNSVDEEGTLNFTLGAADSDLPHNALAYSIQSGYLPGMSLDATSGVFTWTPAETQDGLYSVVFAVSDGVGGMDTQTVVITVNEVNQAPVPANPGDQSVAEGSTLVFMLNATDGDLVNPNEMPNPLTYSIVNGGQFGMSLDPQTGTFSWTPDETQDGVYDLTFQVDDGEGGAVERTITITVAEVNASPLIGVIGDFAVNENTSLDFAIVGNDADAGPGARNTLSFSATGLPPGATLDSSTGAFHWTPTDDGIYEIVITVDDNGTPSLSDTKSFRITVANVSPSVSITGAPASVGEGTVVILGSVASDLAGAADPLTYAWSVTRNASPFALPVGTVTAAADFSFTPTDDGSYLVTLTVGDGDGGSATATKSITVNNVAPTGTYNAPTSVVYGSAIGVSITGEFDPSITDIATTLRYSFGYATSNSSPLAGSSYGSSSTTASANFSSLNSGIYYLFARIIDHDGGYTEYSSVVTVNQKIITPSITANSKVYDGTISATLTSQALSGVLLEDLGQVVLNVDAVNFGDENAGTGKMVTASGLFLSGVAAGNYALSSSLATTIADITPRNLWASIRPQTKIYTGSSSATLTPADFVLSGLVGAEGFTVTKTSGAYSISDVGLGTVVANLAEADFAAAPGTLASNYTLPTIASGLGQITAKTLTPYIAANHKAYDGGTTATLSTQAVTGVVPVDTADVSLTVTSANFDTASAGTGKTVTALGLALSGAAAGNYTLGTTTSVSTTADINQAIPTVSVTNNGGTYGGSVFAATAATVAGVDSTTLASFGDPSLTYHYYAGILTTSSQIAAATELSGGAPRNAGLYTVVAHFASANANYTSADSEPVSFMIAARAVTITADAKSKTYGDADSALTYQVTSGSLVAGEAFTGGLTRQAGSNVGIYAIHRDSLAISSNYAITYVGAELTITPRTLHVTASASQKVYDASTSAIVTLYDDRVAGDIFTETYATAAFADKNVGTGKTVILSGISISGGSSTNYTLANTVVTTTATISPRSLTVSATGSSKTYDGDATASVTLSDDRVTGDVLATVYGLASFSDKNVGIGKSVSVSGITINGIDAGNYAFNATTGTSADITTRHITGSFTTSSKIYDGTTSAAVLTRSTVGDVGGVVLIGGAATFADKNVENDKVATLVGATLMGDDAANYVLDSVSTTTASISARTLTVSAIANNKVYDGATIATVTLSDNRVSGDVIVDSYLAATFADKNVAANKAVSVVGIGLSGTDAGNYTFNTSTSTTAEITSRSLMVSATGVNRVYDGTTGATVALSDDRLGSDVVTTGYTTAVFTDKNVGANKTVYVTGISITGGADAGNYTLDGVTTTSTTADITAATLSVAADPLTKVYGASDPALSYVVSGLQFGDTGAVVLAGELTRASGQNVGSYAINQNTLSAGANYTISFTGSSLAITARPITVTADANGKTYGDADPSLTYQLTSGSLVSGDGFSGSLSRASGENVGTYAITQGTVALNSNYALTYVGADLRINRAYLTVTADSLSRPYGEANPTLSGTVAGIHYGDAITATYSTTATANSAVGTYSITVSLADPGGKLSNYEVLTTLGTLTVTPPLNEVPRIGLLTSSSPNGRVAEGELVLVAGLFSDSDRRDKHTAVIDWGDGTTTTAGILELFGVGALAGSHSYANGGIYTITVSLSDDWSSASKSTQVVVAGAVIKNRVLYVIGSNDDDNVTVSQSASNQTQIQANFLHGQSKTFSSTLYDSMVVLLGDGDDRATIASSVAKPAILSGGDGNDELYGGSGSSILLGGAGNDRLAGGLARDLLIGGVGADQLTGNAGDDILIGGFTAFDLNEVALAEILSEWNSSRSYATRVANLKGPGTGPRNNGSTFLIAEGTSATVFDDGAVDVLTGSAGLDWFLFDVDGDGNKKKKDKANDLASASEIGTDVDQAS
ncbi:YDG domain-containing protein [Singulisphaera sp. Ch08]|uniref:YDG domain-containing protein n=1 Tax=Singulisphaera sp. Ch08 TaxID=3120278 RepID=A0AAU7CFN2_9BACT